MTFRTNDTLAGYARTAVDLRTDMVNYHRTVLAEQYLQSFLHTRLARHDPDFDGTLPPKSFDAMRAITSNPWQLGEPYVIAPAMTAIVAAAAAALDLTGEVLPDDMAPDDGGGVLFLPEPIYHRHPSGAVFSIGAITWAHATNPDTGRSRWYIAGWADHHDPHDPSAARRRAQLADRPDLARQFGPYVLTDLAEIPIGRPVDPRPDLPVLDEDDRDWEPAPDGRFCIDETTAATPACAAIAYAFWRIQAQPLATVAHAPVDRAARRRAARASIRHDTRVVMLRRTSPLAESGDGEPKFHYRVRFIVRGHWRRLIDRDGHPYRIWINAHINLVDRTTGVSCRNVVAAVPTLTRKDLGRGVDGGAAAHGEPARHRGARGSQDRQRPGHQRPGAAVGRGGRRGRAGRAGQRVLARPAGVRIESSIMSVVQLRHAALVPVPRRR